MQLDLVASRFSSLQLLTTNSNTTSKVHHPTHIMPTFLSRMWSTATDTEPLTPTLRAHEQSLQPITMMQRAVVNTTHQRCTERRAWCDQTGRRLIRTTGSSTIETMSRN